MIVILQTYKRTEYALAAIRALKERLAQPVGWFVVDDGSDDIHMEAICDELSDALIGFHSQRIGYGALANIAWRETIKHDPITLWLEDDWVLDRAFDPAHYINLLNTNSEIGMVRLCRIPIGQRGEIIGDGSEVYLKLYKGVHYYFSGNPSIRHSRFYEAYGDYPNGLEPGDTEVAYDAKIQNITGPDIIIPINIGTWGLFGHIGTEKSY
jgi:hypothetical protein